DPDANEERWTRIWSGLGHRSGHEFHEPRDAVRWCQHCQPAHVVAAGALGEHAEFKPVARDDPVVDDRRRVVPRIHTIERAAYDGGPEISLPIALAHALVDGTFEIAVRDVEILAEVGKNDSGPRVLADRVPVLARDPGILEEPVEDRPADG